jgi:GxxExxY protein
MELEIKKRSREELNELSGKIVDACITVHKEMGPGLLKSVYEACLVKEFELRGIQARNQVLVPLIYKGFELQKDFGIDILAEDEILIEVKSAEIINPVHGAQIISYLKLKDRRLGFLVNFNVALLKDGIKRYVNNF